MTDKKHDNLPAQPVEKVHDHTGDNTHKDHHHEENDRDQHAHHAPARPGHTTQEPSVEYNSNPFSITFNNFSKMFKHAQAVAIVMVVFGVLGSFGNIPSFDSSEFDDIRNEDFSFLQSSPDVLGESTVAQNSDAENSLIEGVNLGEEDINANPVQENNMNAGAIGAIIGVVIVVLLVFLSIGLAIGAIWSGIVATSANMAVRDRDISFGDAFSQSISRFGTMFVALFIATLKTIGGYFLLIVPGIRAQARYAALPYVVMGNPSMSAGDAVKETKRLYDGHLLEAFSIVWVGGVVPFVGSILDAVGLAQSARQISDYKSRGLPKPPMSGWNWLPIIVGGVIALFIILVLVAVLALVGGEIS